MNARRLSSGFTLTELLIVVAIAGILAAIAIPGFQSLTQSQQVKNAGFELFSSLSLARSEAIKHNNNVTVTPADTADWGRGWTITKVLPDGTTNTVKSQGALKGVSITATDTPASVVYARTGRTTAATAPSFQIDVSPVNTNVRRCIKIELSGMPRSIKTTGACP